MGWCPPSSHPHRAAPSVPLSVREPGTLPQDPRSRPPNSEGPVRSLPSLPRAESLLDWGRPASQWGTSASSLRVVLAPWQGRWELKPTEDGRGGERPTRKAVGRQEKSPWQVEGLRGCIASPTAASGAP